MIREQILQIWTNLKAKLSLYPALLKNKELIKDALEIHANLASERWSGHSRQMTYFQAGDKRVPSLSLELTKEIDFSELEQRFKPTTPFEVEPGISQSWKSYYSLIQEANKWNSFLKQKQKNQQITKDCNQLISKLQEF